MGTRIIGSVADSVSDAISVTLEWVKTLLEFSSTIDRHFVDGIASIDDRMTNLVDVERLMLSHEMELVFEAYDRQPVAIRAGAPTQTDVSHSKLNGQKIVLL